MTPEALIKKIAELEAEKKVAEINFHRLGGAVAALQELLKETEAKKAEDLHQGSPSGDA